ncbi:uncharacterized protein [Typha latifolia]|uniref:uncharacterized protein isoform X1 n=1 Tax=Typha latifolia TaxID=4733 RepID=UPI003C2D92E0
MEHLVSAMNRSQGSKHHGEKLMDEMKELGKLRTAVMVEKCQIENKKVMCPKPRKCGRLNRDNNELRVSTDLSDIILCKASPPYYAGSPPIRTRNPLIHDSQGS